jgi:hypothetical protein
MKKLPEMKKLPDLDDVMEPGMPLWKALEVWAAIAHEAWATIGPAFPEDRQDEPSSGLSAQVDKPNTRLH